MGIFEKKIRMNLRSVKGEKVVKITNSPNILFVVIDALRAKNLGCYGYSKPTSPNIDNLAREGILFENAFSCSNVTDASLTTIFSGTYPMSHGILSHGGRWLGKRVGKVNTRKLDEIGIRFLPEILKSKGYTTLAVDWLGRWHRRGYDHYSGMLHEANPIRFPLKQIEGRLNLVSRRYARLEKSTIIDEARLVTMYAENLIARNCDKKFLLFLHYWDLHSPYAAPAPFYKNIASNGVGSKVLNLLKTRKRGWKYDERTLDEWITRYDASIAYVDHEIGVLVDVLEKYGILDQTLIVLTSDHGESLTEHGIYFDHHGLYDVSIHVPLIFRYSAFPENKRITAFVQHFDLVPTILNLLEIDKKKLDGKSVLPLIYGETTQLHSAVFAEEALYQRKRAIRTANYKYIQALSQKGAICRRCKRIHGGIKELYDLNKDPEEKQNIIEKKTSLAGKLKERMSKWIDGLG